MDLVILISLAIVVSLVLGIISGFVIASIRLNHGTIGTLRVDRSDPDGPYFFLELKPESLKTVCGCEYVTLKVKAKDYVSQE